LDCIIDADKEGFLLSETSLIQTIGRTARNDNEEVILYADTVTESMQRAIDETNRRREVQLKYNEEHGITPETIRKAIRKGIEEEIQARKIEREAAGADEVRFVSQEYLNELEAEMLAAAENLEFERAANLRDKILDLKKKMGESIPVGDADTPGFAPNSKGGRRGGGRRGKGKGRGSRGRVPRPKRGDA
ncbi:MAG: UvrB/UvrC motif-containing protein, partial [Maioricimonas sp. JB045]